MGFVGGGVNIAIATALPQSFVYCTILFFMLARSFSFWILRLTLARVILFLLDAEYSARNLSDLTVALSETLVSDMHHVLELLVPGLGLPVLLCRGMMPQA